jgi:tricorn protease
MFRILLSLLIFATCHCVTLAESQGPLLLENPTVSRTKIAFSYAGDIWMVDRSGGTARRLTTSPAREVSPTFSPDGSQVAFARFNPSAGPLGWDVYVVSVSGGEERRVTYHPDVDLPVNWTGDGKNILIMSFRHRISAYGGRLYTIPVQGGFATEVPVPRGWKGSFSPAGDRIAYTPLASFRELMSFRHYHGGATSRIWLVKLSDASTEVIPRGDFNDTDPMWIGDKVYFVSDRDGTENLFSYDTARKTITQLTSFEKYGIKSASSNSESIVFNQGGAIHTFNPQTNQVTKIDIRISGEFPETQPRKIDTSAWTNPAGLSPRATHLLLGVRGEVFTGNCATGEVTNITKTGGAVERDPVWSPDGKWIAYFSDESGETELHLQTAPAGTVRRIPIEKKSSRYDELVWSPDSKKLAFTDWHFGLWSFDLENKVARRIDHARYTDGTRSLQPSWSPDGAWLAYTKFGVNLVRSIALYSFETGKITTITSPHMDASQPLFDNNGKYLYFIGSNRTALIESGGMSGFPFKGQVTRNLYAVVLNSIDPSPQRVDQSAAAMKASPVVIDLENIGNRILFMPFWPPDANRIMVGKAGTLFIVESNTLHKFVNGKPGLEKFIEGASSYRISSDGALLALRRKGVWSVVSTDAPSKPEEGQVKLNPIELTIDPREEWKELFVEAARLMRETFYDPNLHGQNLAELQAHYGAYLPNISTREDLNTLLKEMFSHLSVSHLNIYGGDVVVPQGGVDETVGLLGADIEVENGHYRIKRILQDDNTVRLFSPLALPGVNIKAGEFILAVDGVDITADQSFYRYFLNKANTLVSLKVAATAEGKNARTVKVVPIPNEYELRNYDWVEANRRRVTELSGGKLGYVYMRDTSDFGYNAFNREFYAQLDKQGLILDARFNGGGRPADYVINILRRVPLQQAQLRDAEDSRIPTGIINGLKVMLTNESAGSGGDTLPWMWQRTKIGPMVGTRTAGLGIGASEYQLFDGGIIQIPDFGWYNPSNGTWLVENRGVTPDYEVEIMPPMWRAGRDPQLEKAVELAIDALKKTKTFPSKRPTYPVYK